MSITHKSLINAKAGSHDKVDLTQSDWEKAHIVDGITMTGDIITDLVTGTKIGATGGASGEKYGFWGATPIVQPVFATAAEHTVDELITVLQTLGLVRQS
jgi:hypothetical protein